MDRLADCLQREIAFSHHLYDLAAFRPAHVSLTWSG